MTITCCKHCGDRTMGCHITCELYKQQRAELDKFNKKEREAQQLINYTLSTLKRCIKQYR